MNVAVHAQNLGMKSALISRIGADPDGEALEDFLRQKAITQSFIQVDPEHPTGIVEVNFDRNGTGKESVEYEIIKPVAWDFIGFNEELEELVSVCPVFLFGSLASREAQSRVTLRQLIDAAKHKVFDINLRAPHYQWDTLSELLQKSDTLKMNEDEFDLIISRHGKNYPEKDALAWISERYQIPSVILTCGSRGAGIYADGTYFWQDAFDVEVADVVGSGDAFLAAILFSMDMAWSFEKGLRFACAAGALVASKSGAVPPISLEEIKHFADL